MNAPNSTNGSWKNRNPFAFGIICGSFIGLAVVGAAMLTYQVAVEKPSTAAIKTVEAKRVDLLRPLISGSLTATASEPTAPPEDLQADCQKFIATLQALLAQSTAHIDALRSEMSSAYLAGRSSEIDLDSLTAKANALKQDLADFQQAYTGIDPLISSLTPDQINQVSDIKYQFTKYQRLSGRFDNTLAGIDDYRNRLAESEAYATVSAAAPSQSVATNNEQPTNDGSATVSGTTTTTTVSSQPGYVYTNPVYYYDNSPTVGLWFGYGNYDPFWATSYYYPYWGYKHRYYPPPPRPPHPPGPKPGDHDHGPEPRPGNPNNPGKPPFWNQPGTDNPRPNPGKPMPPRSTITIPANNNNQPNQPSRPAWTRPGNPSLPANNQPATPQPPAWQQRPTQPDPVNNNRPTPARANPSFPQPAPQSRPQNISSKPQASRPAPQPQPARQFTPPPSRPAPPPRQEPPPSRPSFQSAPQRQSPPPSAPRPQPSNNGGGRHR